ncbi:MAG: hypothetical protein HY721_12400 [Planctomycetes bacterium]|nr:hypothetical protein [Planctomycetota bacterium]
MRLLARAYAAVSSAAFGLLLASAAFAAAASWVAPGWARERLQLAARQLARISGISGLERTEPARPRAAASAGAPSPGAPGPSRARAEPEPWIDIGALQDRLRLLEASAPGGVGAPGPDRGPAGKPGGESAEARLAAWETLRGPLLALLDAAPEGRGGAGPPGAASIAALAPRIASRLEAILQERAAAREKLLGSMGPAALVRLLGDEAALTDAQAADLLARLPGPSAAAALDRLSRTSPARAARLIERFLPGLEPRKGRPDEVKETRRETHG